MALSLFFTNQYNFLKSRTAQELSRKNSQFLTKALGLLTDIRRQEAALATAYFGCRVIVGLAFCD
jgi:hypothetical protein